METELIPYSAALEIPARSVVALAPHPDDEVFGCGGALARHIQTGCKVSVIVVSDGAYAASAEQRAEVVATREAESCAAAAILGYPAPTFWRLPDRGITYGEQLVGRLMDVVRALDADLVYAPALTEMHPDHRAVAMAAVEALRRMGSGVRLSMYEIGVPLSPNLLLDISDLADTKRRAMRCFESQLRVQAYDVHIEALNRFRTYTLPATVSMAEAFSLHPGAELAHLPLKIFESEYVRQSRLGLPLKGMQDVPLVSVMIRSMDRETLSDALDSISLQTYPNIEVIVVNAKGGVHRALGAWCGSYPLRIANENGLSLGRGAAANVGLGAAGGELLAFLDDDDTLDADHFSSLVELIRSHAPHQIVAYSGVRGISVRGESHNSVQDFVRTDFDPQRLLLGNFLPIHAPLFPKTLLANGVVFDETLALYEDWDFWVQLSELAPFFFSGRITATYFMGGTSGVSPFAPDAALVHDARRVYFDKWSKKLNAVSLSKISELHLQLDALQQHSQHALNIAQSDLAQQAQAQQAERAALTQQLAQQAQALQTERAALTQQLAQQAQAQQTERAALTQQLAQQAQAQQTERQAFTQQLAQQARAQQAECQAFTQQLAQQAQLHQAEQQALLQQNVQTQNLVGQLEYKLALADGDILALKESTSWRLTRPVRGMGHQVLRIREVSKTVQRALPYAVAMCGGYGGLLKHLVSTLAQEGLSGVKRRILFSASPQLPPPVITHSQPKAVDYSDWLARYDTVTDADKARVRERIGQLPGTPVISVLMPVYNPPLGMLEEAIRSVLAQVYPHWELCIADDASTDPEVRKLLKQYAAADARIKVVFRKKNGHISAASNTALELVTGSYIALFDNDDLLHELALFWVADAVASQPDAGLVYSDEDKVDVAGKRFDPYFKSDWNPDLFLSHNMVSHLGVYRTSLVRALGGFREGYEGSQDYDLALRCIEQLAPQQIVHIPRVLYHWRSHPGSTALAGSEKNYALDAGERTLNDHFARTRRAARAELLPFGMYRTRYAIAQPEPLVSLIIPTRNGLRLIKQCVDSILAKTSYQNYEILVVDNNSDDPATLEYFAALAHHARVRILRDERPFNYSALNNAAVLHARGDYLGLINNDIEVISPDWLEEMLGLATQPGVGAVGARLWYPNDTLQHGGVITGVGGVANHSHKHLPKGHLGYFGRAALIQTFSAVTAACLIVQKKIYHEVGGLDEANLAIAFNDVDFCLRVREAGYRNVWTPYAELYHHESATRGMEDTPEKQLRFGNEVRYMQQRWGDSLLQDPAYSPNLTLEREDFSYAWPPRVAPI